jgi:prevent-host-death family protein
MKQLSSKTIGSHDARDHFSRLLARAARGEEITITKNGVPVGKLVAAKNPVAPRKS